MLDIHRLENNRPTELLFSIDDGMLVHLQPVFGAFKNRTGLAIEPYSDLMLHSGCGRLIEAITDSLASEETLTRRHLLEQLLTVLQCAEAKGYVIGFFGD